MSRLLIAALAAATVLATAGSPAAAQHRQRYVEPAGPMDRYCLQGRAWGYPGNCQFATYQQCMATASGTDAYCGINPQAAYARQRGYY